MGSPLRDEAPSVELLLAFQPGDAVFVTLDDLKKRRAGIPQSTDLTGMFLTLAQKKFNRLCQGFVALGQPIQPFVNRHKLLLG